MRRKSSQRTGIKHAEGDMNTGCRREESREHRGDVRFLCISELFSVLKYVYLFRS